MAQISYLILFIILISIGVGTASAWITITLAGDVVIAGSLDMTGDKIINVGNPTVNSDVATKEYVDQNSNGGYGGHHGDKSKVLFLGNGFASPSKSLSYACIGASTDVPMSSCTRNVPLDGEITNLTASSMHKGLIISPEIGENYSATLVVNGIDTDLFCVISDNESVCQNTSVSVHVSVGDRIDLKITGSSNPNSANVAGSALFTP